MNVSALRSGEFRLYLAGNAFAVNAFWILRVTVGWVAWKLTGSASFVGLIAFLYFAPTLLAGPLFGVIVDRVNLRHAALITQSSLFALSTALLAMHLLNVLGRPQLVVYATVAGFAMAAHSPIRMSMVPRLVTRQHIGSAVNIVAVNFNLARLTGPALGGWLISMFGVGSAMAITALCYLPFLAALAILSIRPRDDAHVRPLPFLSALLEGLQHVLVNDVIRQALVLTMIGSFFVHGTLEILPVFADGVFDRGAAGLGVLTSAAGLGAVSGGLILVILPVPGATPHSRFVYALGLVGLITTALLGQTSHWHAALLLVALMSCCVTAIGIICQSSIQMDIDDSIRGRAMSLWAVMSIGSAAAGAAMVGMLADIFGVAQTLLYSAGIAIVLLATNRFSMRRQPE